MQILHSRAILFAAQKLHGSAGRMSRKGGSMQVFGSSKIFKKGLSVNSSFDISYISSSLDLSKTLSLRRLTQAESMFTVLTFRVIVKVLP